MKLTKCTSPTDGVTHVGRGEERLGHWYNATQVGRVATGHLLKTEAVAEACNSIGAFSMPWLWLSCFELAPVRCHCHFCHESKLLENTWQNTDFDSVRFFFKKDSDFDFGLDYNNIIRVNHSHQYRILWMLLCTLCMRVIVKCCSLCSSDAVHVEWSGLCVSNRFQEWSFKICSTLWWLQVSIECTASDDRS